MWLDSPTWFSISHIGRPTGQHVGDIPVAMPTLFLNPISPKEETTWGYQISITLGAHSVFPEHRSCLIHKSLLSQAIIITYLKIVLICLMCMYIRDYRGQKGVLDSLELDLKTVVSHHEGPRIQTWVLCKSNKCPNQSHHLSWLVHLFLEDLLLSLIMCMCVCWAVSAPHGPELQTVGNRHPHMGAGN